jgi:hypothetical protein
LKACSSAATRAGGFFANHGIKGGDRVMLFSHNAPEWGMSYFGVLRAGDPANLVVIGEFETLLGAFGPRWDLTEVITLATCAKTFRAFITGWEYRYSPVSALYLFGRSQDFALQRVRHSINGIPTGTTLTVAVGDDQSEVVISLSDQTKYQTFLDKLWTAVCRRLMVDILEALRDGQTLTFGDAAVSDGGVTLVRRKLFRANETGFADWFQIRIWNANGQFYIGAQNDKKLYAAMSYIDTPNAHLLEHLIRLKFKNSNQTLSALLQPATSP